MILVFTNHFDIFYLSDHNNPINKLCFTHFVSEEIDTEWHYPRLHRKDWAGLRLNLGFLTPSAVCSLLDHSQ